MKAGIHPEYREVVFQDVTSDFKILTRSTLSSKETIKWEDGKEYPLIKVEVSSSSHPFYTGQGNKIVDTSGRVDRFRKRYQK
ncbi:type B 50S ribosomal protein L31 [Thermomonas alba]|uniref:type B 50S ribosomal protein L31 n=1 Tax=Thermomonas alba TaxID=2888525 RepID=UPI001F034E32|nr:type B 50S ribosomal protein L31 [Thermomonas alba]